MFESFEFESHKQVIQKYEQYDLAWFLACFSHRENNQSAPRPTHEESVESPEPLGTEQQYESTENKSEIMPTWAATNSLLIQYGLHGSTQKTCTGIVAPLLRSPPTDYSTLNSALCLAQGISAVVVGQNRRTVITLDLDLYERAIKLQLTSGNSNWLLRMGELHACFASLHAIGKYIEGSGIDSISIESSFYSPATIRQIFGGKYYKCGIEYHITNVLACHELAFEVISQGHDLKEVLLKCQELRNKLHTRETDAHILFDEIVSMLTNVCIKEDANIGELSTFLLSYMKQVQSLLLLVRATRQGDWNLYLGALEEQAKYYFAHDLYKYARLVPVHLAQMYDLRKTDPETWDDLESGDFSHEIRDSIYKLIC